MPIQLFGYENDLVSAACRSRHWLADDGFSNLALTHHISPTYNFPRGQKFPGDIGNVGLLLVCR